VCQRTLRRQVTEYIRYTRRVSMTQDFTPTPAEQQLYERVSEYLQRPDLFALPSGQRQLITLVLRKILASSSFAIGATLGAMIQRLEGLHADMTKPVEGTVAEVIGDDVEHADELEDEWAEDDADESATEPAAPNPAKAIALELSDLKSYQQL